MAGMGISSAYIKDEPGDFYSVNGSQKSMGVFSSQSSGQFGNYHGLSIDPNAPLNVGSMASNYGTSFQNNYSPSANRHGRYDDEELLESLNQNQMQVNQPRLNDMEGDYNGMNQYDFASNVYAHNNTGSIRTDQNNIYSENHKSDSTASPFVQNFSHAQFRLPSQNFGNSLQSSNSYSESPIMGSGMHSSTGEPLYFSRQKSNSGIPQRKASITRSPMTPKTPAISSLQIGSAENGSIFSTPPTQIAPSPRHRKAHSGHWDRNSSSLNSFGGDFSTIPGTHVNSQISDVLKGTSMPTKLGNSLQTVPAGIQSQEMKRRRRRESHNLVERRRRDNINERIQELSHLVPMHRLEDEKVRKALQNNSPLSPTLAGMSAPSLSMSPPQATSGLAGNGARRATAGNITTGIPIEEKDKGPNKGDILNGAVSWTRDLMWMLHLKLQQQEQLKNYVIELGGNFPFQPSEDEKRMHTELMDSMLKNDASKFHYSRSSGSGLRVPKHTDVKGDSVDSSALNEEVNSSLSPENNSSGDAGQVIIDSANQYWSGYNSGGSGAESMSFKEEDEYGMDITH
ncbi:hypothetical protein K3495_g10618 [Podosphaera aphanis]|nr:hypothetical protein K3495_g10618 [Podosphaera aphanis]